YRWRRFGYCSQAVWVSRSDDIYFHWRRCVTGVVGRQDTSGSGCSHRYMIMRKKILAANWKMNLTHVEAESYVEAFLHEVGEVNDVEIVIIPSFTSIPTLAQASGNAPLIRLGAQNLHWERSGAFTGEISATMLRALFVKYVVIGHSERRTLFGETDEMVQKKVHT